MKLKKLFYTSVVLTIIVFFVLASCGQGTKNSPLGNFHSIKPEIEKVESPESWSYAITDIDFVILETSQYSMIKQINKIVVDDNYYYILDKNLLQIFDKKGNFIKTLPKKGKGPGEATKIHDFCISPKNILYILSEKGNILVYNSLLFSREYQATLNDRSISPVNIIINDDYSYYWMDRFGYSLSNDSYKKLMFASGSAKNQVLSFFPQKYFSSKVSRFNQSEQDYLVTPPIGSDTLFAITKNGIKPYMSIDFGNFSSSNEGNKISEEMDDPFPLLSDLKKQNLVGELMYAVKNENYTSTLFPNPITDSYCNLLVENNTGNTKVISVSPFENVFFPGILYCAFNNLIFSAKESYLIKDCIEKNKIACEYLSEKRCLELLDKLRDVKETDNPVLMIITTKSQSNEK